MILAPLLLVAAAPVQASPAPAPSPAPMATKYNLDTPIETLMADPAAKAVMDADFPGIETHPMYDSFKGFSLRALAPLSNGKITDAMLTQVEADLAGVK